MTRSLERCGFRRSSPSAYSRRGSLQALPELQNVPGCIHVSIEHKPTIRALMHTDGERFVFPNRTAATTDLRRTRRVDFHNYAPSAFSLDVQPVKETAPSCIVYRFCQHPAGKALDVQCFDVDRVVLLDEGAGDGDVMFPARVGDVQVFLGEEPDGVAPALAASDSAAYPALRSLDSNACGFHRPRVLEHLSVAGSREREQAEVNADFLACRLKRRHGYINASESDVPVVISLQLEAHGLRSALDRAVLLKPHLAQEWNGNALAAGYDGGLFVKVIYEDGFKLSLTLKTGVAGLFARFTATKECSEGEIESAQYSSKDNNRNGAKLRSNLPDIWNFLHLVVQRNRFSLLLPGPFAFSQSGVVKFSRKREPAQQNNSLQATWLKPIAVRPGHVKKHSTHFKICQSGIAPPRVLPTTESPAIAGRDEGQVICPRPGATASPDLSRIDQDCGLARPSELRSAGPVSTPRNVAPARGSVVGRVIIRQPAETGCSAATLQLRDCIPRVSFPVLLLLDATPRRTRGKRKAAPPLRFLRVGNRRRSTAHKASQFSSPIDLLLDLHPLGLTHGLDDSHQPGDGLRPGQARRPEAGVGVVA